MSDAPNSFTVTLRHLSPDVERADAGYPEVQLNHINLAQLRAMIDALTELAPKVEYPANPEMRIRSDQRQFLVQVRERQVRFSSWTVRAGGCNLSPKEIVAAISGEEEEEEILVAHDVFVAPREYKRQRYWTLGLLALGIFGSNAITAWWLTRPPRELLPEYRLIEEQPSKRLIERLAGEYETGRAEGDRRLILRRDGTVFWAKYGEDLAIAEESHLSVVGAESGGRPALFANNRSLIEVYDAVTLVYYGDPYTRVQR